jgi:ATP-dependent protease HslVU (ClpYQ) peptidase subunit
MFDRSGIGVFGRSGSDANARLLAENGEFAERLRSVGLALANMAHDLAKAQRENTALKRQNTVLKRDNLRLRTLITGAGAGRPKASVLP